METKFKKGNNLDISLKIYYSHRKQPKTILIKCEVAGELDIN